jgi:nitrate reductase NapE component
METDAKPDRTRRAAELKVFLILAGLLVPVLSITGVGGYGRAVWTYQMLTGPAGVGTTPTITRPTNSAK